MGKYCEFEKFRYYSEVGGWMCEKTKWQFLVGKPNRFINYFRIKGEKVIMTWDLNKLSYSEDIISAPTVSDSTFRGYGKTKDKEQSGLFAKDGKCYIKVGDK